ncbi:hypothetical protein BJ170DRAFT_593671 [Xylariales sp. AK1849]|nr:hypothetical protein BJ170DRAFT_593671 [Xylariales sp. AK1849]
MPLRIEEIRDQMCKNFTFIYHCRQCPSPERRVEPGNIDPAGQRNTAGLTCKELQMCYIEYADDARLRTLTPWLKCLVRLDCDDYDDVEISIPGFCSRACEDRFRRHEPPAWNRSKLRRAQRPAEPLAITRKIRSSKVTRHKKPRRLARTVFTKSKALSEKRAESKGARFESRRRASKRCVPSQEEDDKVDVPMRPSNRKRTPLPGH